MLGFVCKVKRGELILSPEVDEACWFPVEKARELLRRDSIGMSLLEKYLFECGTSAERGTD
jgi:NADH pyrophosphatase NudC (nudix superfamily)